MFSFETFYDMVINNPPSLSLDQMKTILTLFLFLFLSTACYCASPILPGAQQLEQYLPKLADKRVAVFANHTSFVNDTPLVDVLLAHHIRVTKIFAPEHGFRGDKDSQIENAIDTKTGISIISLYGKKLKPSADDLKDVDVLVFDIQDVGVRFYTYISSLQKLMEAAIQYHKPLIILDRPNPNGFYVDGPVLEPQFKSFTGMQPIPVVYGMTMGEYAKMLVGEEWLNVAPKQKAKTLQLTIIPVKHYSHKSYYVPPIKPSPNLPSIQSIYWYPTIGMLEGTRLSVGRGTGTPFQVFGHPGLPKQFTFMPKAQPWDHYPAFKNRICHGWNLINQTVATRKAIHGKLQIRYLIAAFKAFPDKKHFFAGFSYVAGNSQLEQQIKAGMSESAIRKSWAPKLVAFKKIRKKYLLYPDFE